MNDGNPTTSSMAEQAREKAKQAGRDYDKTIKEVKEHFGLLLELRERKIKELQGKLSNRTQDGKKSRPLLVVTTITSPAYSLAPATLNGYAIS